MCRIGFGKTFIAAFGVLVASLLCILAIDETKMRVLSPDSESEVLIRQNWALGQSFVVRLCRPQGCENAFSQTGDIYIYFVKVAWCDSAKSFAVLATGTVTIQFAYDVVKQTPVPFEVLQECMNQAIRSEYDLPEIIEVHSYLLDPIGWANIHDAQLAFRRKHPEW